LEHRTIVGSGNPQTLVWRRDGRADIGDPNGAAVADCASLSYGAVFADGLPAAFRPCAEDEAISDCVAGLKARRT
jgi:hypothetical protein